MQILHSVVRWGWVAATLLWPMLAKSADYLEPKGLTGAIYDKEGGRLLFTFSRKATQTGEVIRVLREYRYPDGSLAAQERVTYERGRLVRFEADELQIGASGHAQVESPGSPQGRIKFQYRAGAGEAKQKQKVETLREEALVNDSLPVFLANHWDELNQGKTVKFRYLVVPRLETIGFKFSRDSAREVNGSKVLRIKMEPTSWVISQMVEPLFFTVEVEPPHRVLQYWGRTTPKMRVGNAWQDLDALSVFNWK